MPLLALLFSLFLSSISAIHDGGFTWSNTPVPLPGATVDYISLTGPQSHIYQWQIYVLFKPPGSTQIMYMTWNWDTDRTWTTPIAIDNAHSNSGGSVTEYYSQPVAIWVDAATNTLTFSIQNVNTLVWGQQMTSTYSAAQQPPNLFTPLTAEMFVFHRRHDSVAYGNCSYDGYSVFEDFPSGTNAYSHGSSAVNNRDPNAYIFYLGANADGTPTGYIHYMWQQQNTGYWSPDIQTRFTVDTDSTISAVPWGNNTSTYIFIFYKYQSNLYYAVLTDDYNHNGHFVPLSGNIGFPIGLTSDSGPTAVVYYDDYFSTQVVQLFYSKYDSPSGTFKVMNALGMPDSWP